MEIFKNIVNYISNGLKNKQNRKADYHKEKRKKLVDFRERLITLNSINITDKDFKEVEDIYLKIKLYLEQKTIEKIEQITSELNSYIRYPDKSGEFKNFKMINLKFYFQEKLLEGIEKEINDI
jgi:hypothetical protein